MEYVKKEFKFKVIDSGMAISLETQFPRIRLPDIIFQNKYKNTKFFGR